MQRDYVPAEPFAKALQDWLGKQDSALNPLGLLAEKMGSDKETVRKIATGKREQIPFDLADRILCAVFGGRAGWDEHPDLYAIYQDFDFQWLDRVKPCVA